MPEVTIVFWRDIPAQVIVGKGRRGAKVALPERFEQAIDRAAMKSGAHQSDAYLSEWRKDPPYVAHGDPAQIAAQEATRLDTEYDRARLKALVENGGHADAGGTQPPARIETDTQQDGAMKRDTAPGQDRAAGQTAQTREAAAQRGTHQ